MKKVLCLAILIFCAYSVFGQSKDGASITIGGFATTNNVNSIKVNNIGLSLAGEFHYERLGIGAEAAGHDGRPARSRYFGSFDLIQLKKIALSSGGGFYRTGVTNGGFGQAGLKINRLTAWGRYGNKNFVEARGQFSVLNLEHFAVGPFYQYTRQDLALAPRQVIHAGGLLFTLR